MSDILNSTELLAKVGGKFGCDGGKRRGEIRSRQSLDEYKPSGADLFDKKNHLKSSP